MNAPIPLLLNPRAGSLFRSGLKDWLNTNAHHFQLVETTSADDLTAQARKLAEGGAPLVAAAGGDGTLMRAAAGLIGTGAALGILPCGTMNVFARELNIGSRRFDVALAAMQDGRLQEVDIFTINGSPFLQMASFGLDARIVQLITPQLKRRLGAAAHAVTAMQVLKERAPLITLRLADGELLSGTELILGNGRRYGGEARLFAHAQLDDGLLEAAMYSQESPTILMEILDSMLQFGATERNTSDITKLRRLESATVCADADLAWQLDGDYAGTLRAGETATISRLPERLRVCVPASPVPSTPLARLMAHPMFNSPRIARLMASLSPLTEPETEPEQAEKTAPARCGDMV